MGTFTDLGSANSSLTPIYQPPTKRLLGKIATMRSSNIDYDRKTFFSFSKVVYDLYNVVCAHARSNRSIISKEFVPRSNLYSSFYIFLINVILIIYSYIFLF